MFLIKKLETIFYTNLIKFHAFEKIYAKLKVPCFNFNVSPLGGITMDRIHD